MATRTPRPFTDPFQPIRGKLLETITPTADDEVIIRNDPGGTPTFGRATLDSIKTLFGDDLRRRKLTANETFFVRTDGNDANDGSANDSANAFLTAQGALDYLAEKIDFGGFLATVKLEAGTYDTGSSETQVSAVVGARLVGGLRIIGDEATPSNVVLTSTAFATLHVLHANSQCHISGVRIQNTGSGHGLRVADTTFATIGNIEWGACGGSQIELGPNAQIFPMANYSIVDSAARHIRALGSSVAEWFDITITLTGTPDFSDAFLVASETSTAFMSDLTFSGSATGIRWKRSETAAIQTYGQNPDTYFPGNANGQGGLLPIFAGKEDLGSTDSPWAGMHISDQGFVFDDSGNEILQFTKVANAVNYFVLKNGNGLAPEFAAAGDDANIGINFRPKGNLYTQFLSGGGQFGSVILDANVNGHVDLLHNRGDDHGSAEIARHGFFGSLSGATYSYHEYARQEINVTDATNGSTDARVDWSARIAGTLTDIIQWGPGVLVGSPTGGMPAHGEINAEAVRDDNTVLTCMVLSEEFLEHGTIDLEKWDALVPDQVIPERRKTVPEMETVEETSEEPVKQADGTYRMETVVRRQPKPRTVEKPVLDDDGRPLMRPVLDRQGRQVRGKQGEPLMQAVIVSETVTREEVVPERRIARRHEVAHLFAAMVAEGFDPRQPAQYFARMKARAALPGMPSRDEWQHNALSLGEINSRLWLAAEMMAIVLMNHEDRIAALETG